MDYINCDFYTWRSSLFLYKRNSAEISIDFLVLGKFYYCKHVYTFKCIVFKRAMCINSVLQVLGRWSRKLGPTQGHAAIVMCSTSGSGHDFTPKTFLVNVLSRISYWYKLLRLVYIYALTLEVSNSSHKLKYGDTLVKHVGAWY